MVSLTISIALIHGKWAAGVGRIVGTVEGHNGFPDL